MPSESEYDGRCLGKASLSAELGVFKVEGREGVPSVSVILTKPLTVYSDQQYPHHHTVSLSSATINQHNQTHDYS